MATSETFFKFRLSKEDKERLKKMAKDAGFKETSEFVRDRLGLKGDRPAPSSSRPDPKKEPGAAGITELADRIGRRKKK